MSQYNTGIFTGGIGGGFPDRIELLRHHQAPSLESSIGNLPVYQQQLMRSNPQAMAEAENKYRGQYRNAASQAANDMSRYYRQNDLSQQMQQMQAANSAANQFFGIGNQMRGRQLDSLAGIMQSILSGGF